MNCLAESLSFMPSSISDISVLTETSDRAVSLNSATRRGSCSLVPYSLVPYSLVPLFPVSSLFPQHFQRPQPENAITRNPPRSRCQDRGPHQRYPRRRPLDMEPNLHPVQQDPRKQVGEDHAHQSRQQPQHAKLHTEG